MEEKENSLDIAGIFNRSDHVPNSSSDQEDPKEPVETHKEPRKNNPDSDDEEPVERDKPFKKDKKRPEPDDEEPEGKPERKPEPVEEPEKKEKADYKAELEKLTRRQKDTERWGNETRKQLAAYKKAVQKSLAEGILTDGEADDLLNHTKYDMPDPDEPVINQYARIWDAELEQMRKYSSDTDKIDQYSHAFQHFLLHSTKAEVAEAMEELDGLKDDSVAFTKRMLEFGKYHNDSGFEDLYNAGSFKNYLKKISEKEKEFNNKIDKLEKEVLKYKKKYEDYTESGGRVDHGTSGRSAGTGGNSINTKDIFASRYK